MGPVSCALGGACVLVIYLTRHARDRTVTVLAWGLFASLVASLIVRTGWQAQGRATPLMLLDAGALYVTGLLSICRFDGPRWLYTLCGALTLQCMAHLAYVCFLLPVNGYILILNMLFTVELAALVWGGALHGEAYRASSGPNRGKPKLRTLLMAPLWARLLWPGGSTRRRLRYWRICWATRLAT